MRRKVYSTKDKDISMILVKENNKYDKMFEQLKKYSTKTKHEQQATV